MSGVQGSEGRLTGSQSHREGIHVRLRGSRGELRTGRGRCRGHVGSFSTGNRRCRRGHGGVRKVLGKCRVRVRGLGRLGRSKGRPLLCELDPGIAFSSCTGMLVYNSRAVPLASRTYRLLSAFLGTPRCVLACRRLLRYL